MNEVPTTNRVLKDPKYTPNSAILANEQSVGVENHRRRLHRSACV